MSRNMCWSIFFISSVTLTLVDSETIGLAQKVSAVPRSCYTCQTNSTDCSQLAPALCPATRPHCATLASSPNFTSSLACVADQLCSLTYSPHKQTYEFICVCGGDLCNRPFSQELRDELLNYASASPAADPNASTDFTDTFFTSSKFANVTRESLYDALTVQRNFHTTTKTPILSPVKITTMKANSLSLLKKYSELRQVNVLNAPRAEALKQEATVPSEDDEDEGEGSGSYEESRSQKRPASAPAAPSSFLPSNENGASHLFANAITIVPFILYNIV